MLFCMGCSPSLDGLPPDERGAELFGDRLSVDTHLIRCGPAVPIAGTPLAMSKSTTTPVAKVQIRSEVSADHSGDAERPTLPLSCSFPTRDPDERGRVEVAEQIDAGDKQGCPSDMLPLVALALRVS